MGVCEGFPNSIMPDENGRADYHGASVNLAARFMSAGDGCIQGAGMLHAWEGGRCHGQLCGPAAHDHNQR